MNQTNNVNVTLPPLRAFGDENCEYITKKELLKLCAGRNIVETLVPRLVNRIHCNPEHPENHNVLYTNMRGSYGKVFDGESFKVEHMDTVCNKIIDTVADMICNGTLNIPEFADYDKKLENGKSKDFFCLEDSISSLLDVGIAFFVDCGLRKEIVKSELDKIICLIK